MSRTRSNGIDVLRIVIWSIVALVLLTAVATAFLHLSMLWRQNEQTEAPIYAVVAGTGDDDPRLQAFLGRNMLAPRDTVDCWFALQNVGTQPMYNVRVEVSGAGFPSAPFTPSFEKQLDPQHVFDPKATLRAGDARRRFNVTALFTWTTDEAGKDPRRKAIAVGPVVIRQEDEPRLLAVTKSMLGVLKDIALPLALLWVTEVYRRRSQAVESAQKQSELDRASWNTMLAKSHANAEKFYIPIVQAARAVVTRFETIGGSPPSDVDAFVYFILLLVKRHRNMLRNIGGYYLQNRQGEDVVTSCSNAFLLTLDAGIAAGSTEPRDDAVEQITDLHLSYSRFRKTTLSKPEVQRFRDLVSDWHAHDPTGVRAAADLLILFREALLYEINRPYQFWYGALPDVPPESTDIVQRLKGRTLAYQRESASVYETYQKGLAAQPRA